MTNRTEYLDFSGIDLSEVEGLQAEIQLPPLVKTKNLSLEKGIVLELAQLPANSNFVMGDSSFDPASPPHEVNMPPFMMSLYPVTFSMWDWVAKNLDPVERTMDLYFFAKVKSSHPVTQVSYYQALEFCARVSQHLDQEYTLPTEAQWEYACRAGTTSPYYTGELLWDGIPDSTHRYYHANVQESQLVVGRTPGTTPVKTYPPNPWGLFDMHGNVQEWCRDDWHPDYNGKPNNLIGRRPWTEQLGDTYDPNLKKVVRGGSWINPPELATSYSRTSSFTVDVSNILGFRIVCNDVF